tara:strand:+ start:1993 stop:2121 length:129 start_codon:yes stop_codon:yes gene_type:complete
METVMPRVGNKHFSYTKEGIKAAKKARNKLKNKAKKKGGYDK